MDYEKKYKEALEQAKKELAQSGPDSESAKQIKRFFPELKESEDEKIRKGIIKYLEQSQFGEEHYCIDDDIVRDYIAWLEKQGKQKSIDNVTQKIHIEKGKWYVCIKSFNLNCNTVVEKGQNYKSRENNTISGENNRLFIDKHDGDASKYFKPWTIKDAKDGDVLANNGNIILFKEISNSAIKDYKYIQSHCLILAHSSNFYTGGSYNLDDGFHPATKEQRELLFAKMKEAGYEWDADTKELKKIKQKPIWSEEDEKFLTTALWHISNSVSNGKYTDCHCSTIEWLKSLKDIIQQLE